MAESMGKTANLLFELGTEELPPTALKRLSDALTREFVKGLDDAGLAHGEVTAYSAPRRLAVLVLDCALSQADRDIERRGPALQAAFADDGTPTKAAEGFARSCGTTVDQLQKQETEKGTWLVYKMHEAGKPAAELLPGIAENALNRLPIPKRMRWGSSEAQFVRPVHWLVFLHGDHVVPCTLLDAEAGNLTYGHRFHHPNAITLYNPEDYADVLESLGKVIAHFGKRRARIKAFVEETAGALGGRADLDDDLLDEVTALNEWPQPISGTFEERFLEVPQEALVATMKTNQTYFPIFDSDGRLMNHTGIAQSLDLFQFAIRFSSQFQDIRFPIVSDKSKPQASCPIMAHGRKIPLGLVVFQGKHLALQRHRRQLLRLRFCLRFRFGLRFGIALGCWFFLWRSSLVFLPLR